MANNSILWRHLDLGFESEGRHGLPGSLIGRIENAHSITAICGPDIQYGDRGWSFSRAITSILDERQNSSPPPHLRSFKIRSTVWGEGLLQCLPNLVELDIGWLLYADPYGLTSIMITLGSSLKKLSLDGLTLCRSIFPFILGFESLEHLSLSMCHMSPGTLQWFLTGVPVSPECDSFPHASIPHNGAGYLCRSAEAAVRATANTVMPRLQHLDLKYVDCLKSPWLDRFHVTRLGLVQAESNSRDQEGLESANSALFTRTMHFDVRGCTGFKFSDLQEMESRWPGTWFTPSVKIFGRVGNNQRAPATPLPIEALPIAMQADY